VKFGTLPVSEAEGCILAHATMAGPQKIKKGTLLNSGHVDMLTAAGIAEIVAARLDAGDVPEDEAAKRVSVALCGDHIDLGPAATGRVNLYAKQNGVFLADRAGIDRLNRIDPAITFATLSQFAPVTAGQMVATAKIIPLAVSARSLDEIENAIWLGSIGKVSVSPFAARKIAVISTVLPGLKPSVIDKTLNILTARLAPSRSEIIADMRVAHDDAALAEAILTARQTADIVIIFGASAVIDSEDVVPAAIARAGGAVEHIGMPVDPGNLLVLGRLADTRIIGAPGCARSPKENGFDHVLNRLLANIAVTPEDITGMGVGGLLMEIASRPQPREAVRAARTPKIEAVILAAGQSRRSGAVHKLKAEFGGVPLLRKTVQTAIAAGYSVPMVILGFEHIFFTQQLQDIPHLAHINYLYAEGLSASLKCAVSALAPEVDGALILLADMPAVTADDIRKLGDAFIKSGGTAIIRATDNGKRGNPVVLPRTVFPQIMKLQGDVGAKPVIEGFDGKVIDVEIGRAASIDVDTVEAIQSAGGKLPG
jgi:molybdenum cofactor cytidylyltransferase